MNKVHIVIPDLHLPRQLAEYASSGLRFPALEKILARALVTPLQSDNLEAWLCENFGDENTAIAPLTLQADGLDTGDFYWLRADPVGISMQRNQTVLQGGIQLSHEESSRLCTSLNDHFASVGLHFLSPHPQRWYLKLAHTPDIKTFPLPQVVGTDVHAHLPYGGDALYWHGIFNEVQMLFYEHEVNQTRELRGDIPLNGIWLWGGGRGQKKLRQPFTRVAGDSELAHVFAQAAGIGSVKTFEDMPLTWTGNGENLLLVFEALRTALQQSDIGRWRSAVKQFEALYAVPLLEALNTRQIDQITLDVLSEGASRRFLLTRRDLWKIWRHAKPLLHYAATQHSA